MQHSQSLADYFKTGHSLSFDQHSLENVEMLRARSALVLSSRGPSLPVTPVDLSADLVTETIMRRKLHQEILSHDPTAFHRKTAIESASILLKQRKEIKNLLEDMHPMKDPHDLEIIQQKKRLTYSRRRREDAIEKKEREDTAFHSLQPIEDFLRPQDSASPRITGYDHGHIRSLLKLDIFGEADSARASRGREEGKLPLPPNVDRFARYGSLSPSSLSRASTASSFGMNSLRQGSSTSTLPMLTAALSASSHSSVLRQTTPLSLRHTTGGSGNSIRHQTSLLDGNENSRVLKQDRLYVDAFVRRKEWHKTYLQRVEGQKEGKTLRKHMNETLRKKQETARHEKNAIADFENHLSLSKFHTESCPK